MVPPNAGTNILHYKLGPKLGSGGMGEVYQAEDTRLGRQVALKFLAPEHRSDPEKRWRLFQEARAASALRSPHIAVMYDVIETQEHLFLAMEYVEGELLSRRLERGPLTTREAVQLGLEVAEALEEAHAHGVIHRDIKGANVMLTSRGHAKVLDFGIAKQLERGATSPFADTRTHQQVTSPGVVLGTVSFMSPEQALGRPLDPRSDLFSLGVLLYQMITGRLPFEGESITQIIDRILHHEPTPAAVLNASIPGALSILLQHALEKDLEYRTPSATALAAGLRRLALAYELENHPDLPSLDAQAPSAAGRTVVLASHGEAPSGRSVAVLTYSNLTREPADEWIGTGIAETVTADLQSIPGVTVLGRARVYEVLKTLSSGALQAPDERIAMELGRRLGVTWIVRGAYQRVGDHLRITAHLGSTRDGSLLKTVRVDGPLGEIFQLQDRIVVALSQALSLQVGHTELSKIERKETSSVEAYECHSRGILNLRTGDRDSLDRAILLFERAVELDPSYADAWAGLAAALTIKGNFLGFRDLLERGVDRARRSIQLDPGLSRGHAWLGAALNGLGRHDEAIAANEEAIRLDPQNAVAYGTLARSLWVGKGRLQQGIEALEKCVALNPEFGHAYLQIAFLHATLGNLDPAEAAARRAIDLQERKLSGSEGLLIVGAHARLGYVHALRGQYQDAIREYELEKSFLASSDHALRERTLIELEQKLGSAHLRLGQREEAQRHLRSAARAHADRLQRGSDEPFTRYYAACAHTLLGDLDEGLRLLLQTAAALPALTRERAARDPDLDALRGLPGFSLVVSPAAVA